MNPKQQLESILSNQYESEDGDLYRVELFDGMSDSEIENLNDHRLRESVLTSVFFSGVRAFIIT